MNARDREGRTALQIAADYRAAKAAQAILDHGPSLADRRAAWGRSDAAAAAATPVEIAAETLFLQIGTRGPLHWRTRLRPPDARPGCSFFLLCLRSLRFN